MVKFMTFLKTQKLQYVEPDIKNPFLASKIPQNLDCVIIGSGMGGLMSAAILAKKNKKVLVLEQHDIAGGCLHTFSEKGFTFDTGLHYIGVSKESGFSYMNMLSMALTKPIEWVVNQNYDMIKIADEPHFTFTAGKKEHIKNLQTKFPEASSEINELFIKLAKANSALKYHSLIHLLFPTVFHSLFHAILNVFYSDVYKKNTLEVFQKIGLNQHQILSAILLGQLGDIGVLPAECGFMMYSGLVLHYINGSHFPQNGTLDIVRSIVSTINQSGGVVLVKAHVSQILIQNNKVTGVQMKNGSIIECQNVISSIGRPQTSSILPNNLEVPAPYPQSRGHIYGFFGIDEKIQYPEGNLWYWPYTKEQNYDMALLDRDFAQSMVHDKVENFSMNNSPLFIKFHAHPENKNGQISLLVITQAPEGTFEKYYLNDVKRSEGYKEVQEQIRVHIVKKLEDLYPQVKGKIVFSDIGTSLTNMHYFQRYSSYGMKLTKERLFDSRIYWNPQTSIQGLWITGQDVTTPGVSSAITSGFITAGKFLGEL